MVPNELTRVRILLKDVSLHISSAASSAQAVLSLATLELSTNIIPDLPRSLVSVAMANVQALLIDDTSSLTGSQMSSRNGVEYWTVSFPSEQRFVSELILLYSTHSRKGLLLLSISSTLSPRFVTAMG